MKNGRFVASLLLLLAVEATVGGVVYLILNLLLEGIIANIMIADLVTVKDRNLNRGRSVRAV